MRRNNKHKIKRKEKEKIIKSALSTYDQINEEKNHFIINTMLKLFYEYDQAENIQFLLNDIGILRNKRSKDVSFPLLMKTCIKAKNVEINECILILKWMKECKYKLRLHGFFLNKLIGKCVSLKSLQFVHSLLIDKIIEDNNEMITKTVLINAYSKRHSIKDAKQIFDGIDDKDCMVLGAMMNALIENEWYNECLALYEEYTHLNNETTHILAIRACAKSNLKGRGLSIIKNKIDLSQCADKHKNVLIDFYGHFGEVEQAINVYQSLPNDHSNIYAINGIMKAYLDNNQSGKVVELFDTTTIKKDSVSYLLAIKACGHLKKMQKGRSIHMDLNDGLINTEIKNALIDMYSNCADIEKAEAVYHSIDDRNKDIVTVSAMMNAYCNNDLYYECMELFNSLQTFEHIEPDVVCHGIALKACCNGDLHDFGQEIFVKLSCDPDKQWMLNHIDLQIPFISLFGKSGIIEECKMIFEQICNHQPNELKKEIKIWNAMIKAYVKNNKMKKAEKLYQQMKEETELIGDIYTFSSLLSGYSHSGQVEEAFDLWQNEISDEDVRHDKIVMSSLIDSVCRKGDIAKGFGLIEQYEQYGNNKPYYVMWISLLNGSILNDGAMASKIFDEFEERFHDNEAQMEVATKLMKKIL